MEQRTKEDKNKNKTTNQDQDSRNHTKRERREKAKEFKTHLWWVLLRCHLFGICSDANLLCG